RIVLRRSAPNLVRCFVLPARHQIEKLLDLRFLPPVAQLLHEPSHVRLAHDLGFVPDEKEPPGYERDKRDGSGDENPSPDLVAPLITGAVLVEVTGHRRPAIAHLAG